MQLSHRNNSIALQRDDLWVIVGRPTRPVVYLLRPRAPSMTHVPLYYLLDVEPPLALGIRSCPALHMSLAPLFLAPTTAAGFLPLEIGASISIPFPFVDVSGGKEGKWGSVAGNCCRTGGGWCTAFYAVAEDAGLARQSQSSERPTRQFAV